MKIILATLLLIASGLLVTDTKPMQQKWNISKRS